MGERERGKTDTSAASISSTPASTSATLPQQMTLRRSVATLQTPMAITAPIAIDTSNTLTSTNKPVVPQGWSASWRQIIWEKWRWGVLIALAVIVSRLSAGS